jgi:radical SAM superfamily enzyme YgiQ (UPF0313 family)
MRIALARVRLDRYAGVGQRRPKLEHLGLGYLAACLRLKGHEVEIVDAELQDLDEVQTAARLGDCDLAGVTMPDATSARTAIEFLSSWKRPAGRPRHVTVGGHGATVAAGEILAAVPSIDSVVLYEGEETLPELAARLAEDGDWRATPGLAYRADGGGRESAPRAKLQQLDDLPFPARDTLPALLSADPNAAASVLSSRGCYRHCTFCGVAGFFGNWRGRAAGNVTDELARLKTEFGVRRVDFQDDNFVGPGERGRARAVAIATQMQARRLELRFRLMCSADAVTEEVFSRLAEAGLYSVFVGIESGSRQRLRAYRKGTVEQNVQALQVLERLGLLQQSEIGFIMFDPDGDLQEIADNLAFLREHVRFITPGTLFNARDDIHTLRGSRASLALPEPLRLARGLFTSLLMASEEAYLRLEVGSHAHTETWRLGVLDIASGAVASLSELLARGRLTDESYQELATAIQRQAEGLTGRLSGPTGN